MTLKLGFSSKIKLYWNRSFLSKNEIIIKFHKIYLFLVSGLLNPGISDGIFTTPGYGKF